MAGGSRQIRAAALAAKDKLVTGKADKVEAEDDEAETMDEMGYSDGEDDSESDEGSDYCAESTKTPPKKRAKLATSSSGARPSTKVTRGKKSLSLLLTMPLDVLFEIFMHLSPRDIIHLTRTSKLFRDTLMAKNSTTIWKSALQRSRAPDCPTWLSEPAWTNLLFGHTCYSCGTGNVHVVEFLLLRRLCIDCKKKHYVSQTKFPKRYPELDMEILDLIPRTNQSWIRSYGPKTQAYYWDGDIALVVKKLAAFAQDISNGLPNAKILLHDFKEEKKSKIQEIKQKHKEWNNWLITFQSERSSEATDAMNNRLERIKQKFRELGYIDADLSSLGFERECRQPAPLTERIWKRIRPVLEPKIQDAQKRRLAAQMEAIRRERRQALHARYQQYQRSLAPSQWKYLPSISEISHYDAFAPVIDTDPEVNVTGSMFDNAFENFSEHHAAAMATRRASLRPLLPHCEDEKEEGEVGETDILELATAVFQCQTKGVSLHFSYVFGWDEIASHHCLCGTNLISPSYWAVATAATDSPSVPELQYSMDAAKVVEKVVRLSGLDPMKATATDMDQKNLRFSCACCPPVKMNKDMWQIGYAWRFMVEHLVNSMTHNPSLEINIIPVAQANEVKRSENDSQYNREHWTCAHCPEYLGNLQRRGVVLQHLHQTHGISIPSEPTDLFFFERYKLVLPTKPKYCVRTQHENKILSSMFRCLLCPGGKQSQRSFSVTGVGDHLKAKHQIQSAQRGVHYGLVAM